MQKITVLSTDVGIFKAPEWFSIIMNTKYKRNKRVLERFACVAFKNMWLRNSGTIDEIWNEIQDYWLNKLNLKKE